MSLSIASSSAATLLKTPRRIRFRAISAKNRSTWFSHDALVGVSAGDFPLVESLCHVRTRDVE